MKKKNGVMMVMLVSVVSWREADHAGLRGLFTEVALQTISCRNCQFCEQQAVSSAEANAYK